MLNNISLVGRIVQEPDLRFSDNGRAFLPFTIANGQNYKNKKGERDVNFIDCIVGGKRAKFFAKQLYKGRLVGIEGSLQVNVVKKDERTYKNVYVNVRSIDFYDWPEKKDDEDKFKEHYE